MNKAIYTRRWKELRKACKERANWQCAFVDEYGRQCEAREGDELISKHSGRKYIRYLHAAHLTGDSRDPEPALVCLCAEHHTKMDRQNELKERMRCRRRGYALTTTDALISSVKEAGLHIEETASGYYWQVDCLSGRTTTAIGAVTEAIYSLLECKSIFIR